MNDGTFVKEKCVVCGKRMKPRKNKIYCGRACLDKANYLRNRDKILVKSRAYYDKVKDTEEYKVHRREYFKKWVSENKDKFYKMVNENSLRYFKKRRELFESMGVCVKCGGERDSAFKTCGVCREYFRNTYLRKKRFVVIDK